MTDDQPKDPRDVVTVKHFSSDARDGATAESPIEGSPTGMIVESSEGRYEILDVVGRGGIGEVFLARDLRLGRQVALKRLTSQSPLAAERLLREAQHQARVDHPYVCKVYGFGEHEGRPYIALQFAEGGTLAQQYGKLSASARVRLMQRVAIAVDAAHQIGLIHRDLKPSNILVEPAGDGDELLPLVCDFGIARAVDTLATQTGSAVGTPAYMAPEQAQGRPDIDHRADIYALGVTLYELACGRRPFEGDTPANLIHQVVEHEPRPPRAIDPAISRDLEAIILHCLEKQPSRRYPSARALADDLDRYLKGEPVVARPQTAASRAWKWARRHRGYVALGLVGVLGIALASGIAVRARLGAAERSRTAQRLGSELARIETQLRIAYLLPEHDVGPDRERLAGDLAEVRALVESGAPEAEASGRVILARVLLLLDDPAGARVELDRVRALGGAGPDFQVTLGETLLALYRREAVELESMGPDTRRVRAEELRKAYLGPASEALGAGDPAGAPLVAAELAVTQGKADDAIAAAQAALARDPWLAEAHVLIGQVLRERAQAKLITGDCDGAAHALDDAGKAFAAAQKIARSLPDAHVGTCGTATLGVQLAGCRKADPVPAVDAGALACEAGRKVDPRREELVRYLVTAEQQAAQTMLALSKNPIKMIDRLIATLQIARRDFPGAIWPVVIEGVAYELYADVEFWTGKDPRRSLERSLAAYAEYNRDHATMATLNNMAGVYKTKGNYLGQIGEDPRAAYDQGIAAAERSAELGPDMYFPFYTLGNLCVDRGTWELERGGDPTKDYERAERAYTRMLDLRPGEPDAFNGLAIAAWGEGVYLAGSGGDPSASFEASINAYRKALEKDPENFLPPYNLAEALRYLASWRIVHGGDAAGPLAEAGRLLEALRAKKPPNLEDVEEETAALELALARAAGADAAARQKHVTAALARLGPLPPTPRRMALTAIAVAYVGPSAHADETRALDAWAASEKTAPEADIVKHVLTLARGGAPPETRAQLTEAGKKSLFLRDELAPLLR